MRSYRHWPIESRKPDNGREITLSRKEYELLQLFDCTTDEGSSTDKIEALPDSDTHVVESNALEVHVHNLRKKLGQRELIGQLGALVTDYDAKIKSIF